MSSRDDEKTGLRRRFRAAGRADSERTLSDADQTLSDVDQTGADDDQSSADSDQMAADRDQAASDRDVAAGVDPSTHDLTRELRLRSARKRGHTANARLDAADERDAIAFARDLGAISRDRAAEARDAAMTRHDAAWEREAGGRGTIGAEVVVRAAEQRRHAARFREKAAEHRGLAARDRQDASDDRTEAARERVGALADRSRLAEQLSLVETDPVTGARALAAGLTDLDHELDRCVVTGAPLVIASVIVVAPEDLGEQGDVGDELRRGLVALLGEHLRSFDLVVRLGSDDFLCAMPQMELDDARGRLAAVAAALARARVAGAVRVGFAQMQVAGETAAELIARADEELRSGDGNA